MMKYFTLGFINSLICTLWLCCFLLKVNALNCSFTEKEALLAFKQSLSDPSNRLSSWVGENCCEWHGITCDFVSGKVTKIDLRNSFDLTFLHLPHLIYPRRDPNDVVLKYKRSCLGGEISYSLVHLKHLNYMDLSLNNFEGAPIPYFFGMLTNLRYLNLSHANFSGVVPPHLGNLSSLIYLDICAYYTTQFTTIIKGWSIMHIENMHWLSNLSYLEYLNLGGVNLSSVPQANWMYVINTLSSLSKLHLHGCHLSTTTFDSNLVGFPNLTSLTLLDLSFNMISSSLPLWLSNITTLTTLSLEDNHFHGTIPQEFFKLKNLQHLNLGWNDLENIGDHIPMFLQNHCKLQSFNLANNLLKEIFLTY